MRINFVSRPFHCSGTGVDVTYIFTNSVRSEKRKAVINKGAVRNKWGTKGVDGKFRDIENLLREFDVACCQRNLVVRFRWQSRSFPLPTIADALPFVMMQPSFVGNKQLKLS